MRNVQFSVYAESSLLIAARLLLMRYVIVGNRQVDRCGASCNNK
jgi:hypothetical protein